MDTLFGTGIQGKSPSITAQSRVNCYYEYTPDGDKTKVAILGTPGKELFISMGDTPVRGVHVPQNSDYLYFVHRGTFYSVNNAGVTASLGTLNTTSGRVSIADNGTQIQIVDGSDGWTYNMNTTAWAEVTDVDFPNNAVTNCFDSGRILNSFANSGRFYGSDAYAASSYDGTNFATAESQPDYLKRVYALNGQVILFGNDTIEPWANAGLPGFPYIRVGGANQDFGLSARWSVAPFMGTLAFLAKVRGGGSIVGVLEGYAVTRISTSELDYIIDSYGDVSDATGFSYTLGGHPMYQINFPSDNASWLYDGSTKLWSQLKSYGIDRDRGEIGVEFQGNRIVTDYENGKMYKLKPDVYADNGEELRMEITSRHLYDEGARQRISSFQVDGQMGVGLVSGQGVDPQIMLQISVDGGQTFGSEVWTSLGAIGETMTRARFGRPTFPLSSRDLVFRLAITDPIKRVITGIFINQP